MHYGWTGPVIPLLEKNDTHIHLSTQDHIWLESIYLIGGMAGVPITIFCVDKLGRKETILISAATGLLSWIIIAVANNISYLYLARFVVGVSGDISFVAVPMYIAEIADKKWRGFLSGMIYIMFLIGILIIYTVAPIVRFDVPSFIGAIFVSVQLLVFPFMPDSPYYLVSIGKEEIAQIQLKKLRKHEKVDKEFEEISLAVSRQKTEKGRPQDLVLEKGNRKAILIMLVLNCAQHFSSLTVILMNLHKILTVADSIYLSSYASGILFSLLMLISAFIADMIVDRCGRKFLLVLSSILSGICILVLASYFTLQKCDIDVKSISWVPIFTIMLYGFCFKLGLGLVPIVLAAELFSSKTKATGMAVSDLFYVTSAWITIELYQRLITVVGYDYPFYIFSASCFLTAIFTQMYIPETRGKSLEEIQLILKELPLPERHCEGIDNKGYNCNNTIA